MRGCCKDNVLKTDALKASEPALISFCAQRDQLTLQCGFPMQSNDFSGFDLMEICYLSVVNPWSHVHYHSDIVGWLDGFDFKRKLCFLYRV